MTKLLVCAFGSCNVASRTPDRASDVGQTKADEAGPNTCVPLCAHAKLLPRGTCPTLSMRHLLEFLSSPAWSGVAAIVAILTLAVPGIKFLLASTSQDGLSDGAAKPARLVGEPLLGCGGAAKSLSSFWFLQLVHTLLAIGFGRLVGSFLGVHPRQIETPVDGGDAVGGLFCFVPLWFVMITGIYIWSIAIGRRYGYLGICRAVIGVDTILLPAMFYLVLVSSGPDLQPGLAFVVIVGLLIGSITGGGILWAAAWLSTRS